MARNAPDDRDACAICGVPLPSRYDRESPRGRPRHYCDSRCRERGRRVRILEDRAADARRRGRSDVADRIEQRIDVERRLWRDA